jgi:competence protein ComEC
MKVLHYPLTAITLFFVVGIVFNRFFNIELKTGLLVLVASFAVFISAFLINFRRKNHFFTKGFTVICFILSFAVGNFTALLHQDTNSPNHYFHSISSSSESVNMKVVLVERWKPTEKNIRYAANVYNLEGKAATGKILINFRKSKTKTDLKIGSKLAVNAKLLPHQKPLNPDQFDYGLFLKNKSIFGQVYTDDASIAVFNAKEKSLYYYSAIFRNRVMENLKNSGFNQKELGVVHALILGQRQDLDPTVLQNYQYAGVIHILSVSGLHVGFVLLFLTYFLKVLPNSNRYRVIKVLIIVFILWSFALVAGFSPSVVRSVTMFSFVAIGMYMRRKTYVFYTFYCSIFLILLFEPSFLFDVGFQLSYLALFFILWLQPEFAKIWQPKNKISGHFWGVLTLTFAAQLGTMPLSLFYFHQFPGLFFVANLMIMFLITIIMGVGLFLVLVAFWTEIPTFIAKTLEYLIWFLNSIVEEIASYEAFIFKDISFNFWMMASLFLMIFGIGWFVTRPNFRTTSILLFSVVLFQISYFSFDFNSKNKEELLVFQSRYNSLLLERKGKVVNVFSTIEDHLLVQKDRTIQSFNVANGTSIGQIKPIPNLLFFHKNKIVLLDSTAVFVPDLKPTIILITQSPRLNFDRLIKNYQPELVIVDASNYRNLVEKIRKTCHQQKIPFHAIAEKGFYRIEK